MKMYRAVKSDPWRIESAEVMRITDKMAVLKETDKAGAGERLETPIDDYFETWHDAHAHLAAAAIDELAAGIKHVLTLKRRVESVNNMAAPARSPARLNIHSVKIGTK